MRRVLVIVSFLLIACQASASLAPASPVISQPPPPSTPFPTSPPILTPAPTATPIPQAKNEFSVRLHPDGPLYVGDQVSIEVISPDDVNLEEKNVRVQVSGDSPNNLGSSGFEGYGIGGRMQATFNWVWDTTYLESGYYQIEFAVQPDGQTWKETVNLLPAVKVPGPEPQARWETIDLACCEIHFITGTEFARDLPELLDLIEQQAADAVQRMGIDFNERIPITILPRVLGHGGFASSEIYVSYIENNYAGNDLSQVLHHEMIHILDGRLGGEVRPPLLVEGLAVYLSDGHFKKEPLLQRAAALLDLGWYLPLTQLVDSFYTSQHEIGYLEGGALVQFMVTRYGWQAFNDFYRDIHPHPSGEQSQALDQALQNHFGLTLEQLEGRFKTVLFRQHTNPDMHDDLFLTVAYYEAVRRYQQMLDPSAYFLTAWLPAGDQMRQRGIVADYLRRPSTSDNRAIEELLVAVDKQLRAGNYIEAEKALLMVNDKLAQTQDNILVGSAVPFLFQRTDIGLK
jgi:hypothetical protein